MRSSHEEWSEFFECDEKKRKKKKKKIENKTSEKRVKIVKRFLISSRHLHQSELKNQFYRVLKS